MENEMNIVEKVAAIRKINEDMYRSTLASSNPDVVRARGMHFFMKMMILSFEEARREALSSIDSIVSSYTNGKKHIDRGIIDTNLSSTSSLRTYDQYSVRMQLLGDLIENYAQVLGIEIV